MSDFDAFLEATIAVEPILPSSADLPLKAEVDELSSSLPLPSSSSSSSSSAAAAAAITLATTTTPSSTSLKDDKSENEKFIDEIREWVKRYALKLRFCFYDSTLHMIFYRSTARDSSKRSSNSTSKKKRSGSSKKKAGKEDKSKSKEAGTIKDLSDDDDNATAEGELVLSTDRDNQLKQKGNYVAIDSSFSQSNESFLDINLRDVRMRELSLSQDTDLQSAADRILAVKNSLKKIASVDPYDATAAQKELEEQDANDDDEQEAITAAEIALMESLPFSYRSYDELVRLNREKSYAGLLQRKLEAYLTDEDFEIVFRKNRVRFA